jgi:hypothetical protein
MNKKLLPAIIWIVVCSMGFLSCSKFSSYNGNYDNLYFPLQLGHYVTYNVDSIYYDSARCSRVERKSQVRYSVSDTCRDTANRFSYIIDVDYRLNESNAWAKQSVAIVTQTGTGLEYYQNTIRSVKLTYPIASGSRWYGNIYVPAADTSRQYLLSWDFTYDASGYKLPYNSGTIYFDNTITVLEDNVTINNTIPDSIAFTYRSYAKEIYAQNVGMVYREVTRLNYNPYISQCIDGLSVTMSAVDHN